MPTNNATSGALTRALLVVAACAAIAGLTAFAPAPQSDEACFPETGFCIAGRFRAAWEGSGGLAVFGYPLTPPQTELVEGQPRTVQWFERARFELRPELPPPHDVSLGRLGDERLRRDGRDWRRFLPPQPQEGCRTFAETSHAVCGEFLVAWQSVAADADGDGLVSDLESLAQWGLPLSEAQIERLGDGKDYAVQWFERARFELHPENQPPSRVLFGLLGRELGPVPRPPEPTATPAPPLPTARIARGPSGQPARLAIPEIGLDARVVPVGIDDAGEFEVPSHDVGWYTGSATPGAGENIVLWGHVLPFLNAPQLPAPFARLESLAVGARITLYDADGRARPYLITRRLRVSPNELAYVLPQGRERLTLVSCIGEGVVVGGATVNMSERLITIAEPVTT